MVPLICGLREGLIQEASRSEPELVILFGQMRPVSLIRRPNSRSSVIRELSTFSSMPVVQLNSYN